MESIEGVILAAGLSRRAGTCKMLLDIEGKTLIERCILGMYGVCSRIIVVVGHYYRDIAGVISRYNKVTMVYNPDYLDGMFSSVRIGFKNVSGDRFFFIPGDYPYIKERIYREMLKKDGGIIIPVHKGRKGHPILVRTSIAKEMLSSIKYRTLREFIEDKGYTAVDVNDTGILSDIDTMADYNLTKKHYLPKELL
ncbi:MAG: nucleotidyltransferase family protein [Clostridiales bacterium]|nr:nucleotidyltransferase family protein [Clostridiales bacterium]